MPLAKTHDLITLILAPPTYIATVYLTASTDVAVLATLSMLFAGLMFGPDLDIQSKQYARWGPFGFLWWPYRFIFRHRSRLSHGILLGTAIRVIYFTAMLILLAAVGLFLVRLISGDAQKVVSLKTLMASVWRSLLSVDRRYLMAVFLGLWWGATSHTLTDWLVGIWTNTKRIF
jgi:uncharacterized metal-binding protein